MSFMAGVVFGTWLTGLVVWWFLRHDDGGHVVVERWWLENADRWEWLRTYELREKP